MIYLYYGDDILASYKQLQIATSQYKSYFKNVFSEKDSQSDFLSSVNTQDLIDIKRIYILENFISKKKITPKIINIYAKDNIIFLWEKTNISTLKFRKSDIKILEFKIPPKIFNFLDSIGPNNSISLAHLYSLDKVDHTSLIWQLSNRFYLLILSKIGIPIRDVETITGRSVQDWQWRKISTQASRFDLKTLKSLMSGIIKIDYMVKTGTTNISYQPLISILFLKYLKP